MELILGFILGLIASYVVWYFVVHRLVPTIVFEPKLYAHHINDKTARSEYRIRYRNAGRRDLIDLEFVVKLRVKGLRSEAPSIWRAIYIPVDDARIPLVQPHNKNQTRSVRLLVSEIEKKYLEVLSSEIQNDIELGNKGLELLLGLGTFTELEVYAFCYDVFSGSRKLFRNTYHLSDIVSESDFLQRG